MIPWGWTADGWTCGWVPLQPDNPDSWGTVLADPDVRAIYEERAAEEGQSAFALARTDYFQGKDLLSKK